MRDGKTSRWMKYVKRLVWYAPDTTDSAASIALRRTSTIPTSVRPYNFPFGIPTILPRSYGDVQRSNEIGEDGIDAIQSGQDCYYI